MQREDMRRPRVRSGQKLAPAPGEKSDGDDVPPRIAGGIRVDAHQSLQFYDKARLFAGLPYHGCLNRLTYLYKAARQGIAARKGRVISPDEHNSFLKEDDSVYG